MGFSGSERFSGVLAFSELNPGTGTSWANWNESFTLLGLTVSKNLCLFLCSATTQQNLDGHFEQVQLLLKLVISKLKFF